MKKMLSVLLCMAMLFTMLGAAAPVSEQSAEEDHFCEACQEQGCTKDGDKIVHQEDCLCADMEEDEPCACEDCAEEEEQEDGENENDSVNQGEKGTDTPDNSDDPSDDAADKSDDDAADKSDDDSSDKSDDDNSDNGGDASDKSDDSQSGDEGTDDGSTTEPGEDETGEANEDESAEETGDDETDKADEGLTEEPGGDKTAPSKTPMLPSNAGDGVSKPEDTADKTAENKTAATTDSKAETNTETKPETKTEDKASSKKATESTKKTTAAASKDAGTGPFAVKGGTSDDYEYTKGTLTLHPKNAITVTMAEDVTKTSERIVIDGGSGAITISGLTIVSAKGAAIEMKTEGTLTIKGKTTLTGGGKNPAVSGSGTLSLGKGCVLTLKAGSDGTPAIKGMKLSIGYTHMTYGSAKADGQGAVYVEWTGGPGAAWSEYSWLQIHPMKVNSLTVTPAAKTVRLGGSVDCKALLNITVNDATFDMDVATIADWTVAGSSAGSSVDQKTLKIASDETASKLTVTAAYPASGEPLATGKATVKVLYPASKVTLDKKELKLYVGDSTTLTAAIEPENTYDTASWTVSSEDILSIDQNGNITALAKGEATVTVTAGSVTATCKVTVLAKTYTVTFDANEGTCSTKTATTKDDGTLGTLPTAKKEGLYFAGWYTAKSGGSRVYPTTVFNSDTTLYARWSVNPVTGDENNAALWAALLGVSALAVCAGGVYVFRKSRKNKDQGGSN